MSAILLLSGDEWCSIMPTWVTNQYPIVTIQYLHSEYMLIWNICYRRYFQFRVAPLVNPPITQAQLNQRLLRLPGGADRWELGNQPAGTYNIRLRLPSGFTCTHCVMQWIYTTGNNWMGLRPETFINCADVKIQWQLEEIDVLKRKILNFSHLSSKDIKLAIVIIGFIQASWKFC